MIPCQDCQHENPLGAVFCHRCGARLEVSIQQIAGSVAVTNREAQIDRLFRAARNSLIFAGFLFVVALIFVTAVVPELPPPTITPAPARNPAALFTSDVPWKDNEIAAEASIPPPLPEDIEREDIDLMAWRAREGLSRALQMGIGEATGERVGLDTLGTAQIEILQHQNQNGSFRGTDVLGATALATLALQAAPLANHLQRGPELRRARAKAVEWLGARVRTLTGKDPVVRVLTACALLESGTIDDHNARRDLMHHLSDGDAVKWQAVALLSVPRELRAEAATRGTALTARPLAEDPVGKVLSGLLWAETAETLVDDSAFARVAASRPTDVDLFSWALAAWYRGVDPVGLEEQLKQIARAGTVSAGDDLRRMAPLFADQAMAILVCTAPARAPVTWTHLPD